MIVLCILVLTYFDFYYYAHCSVFMLSIKKIMTVVKAGIFCVILDVLGLSFGTFSRFLNCTSGNKSPKASYLLFNVNNKYTQKLTEVNIGTVNWFSLLLIIWKMRLVVKSLFSDFARFFGIITFPLASYTIS